MGPMQRVEIDEVDEGVLADLEAPVDVPRRGRRRGALAVLGAGLVVVLVLAVGQVVLDRRERALRERWADVPGVIRPLGDSVEYSAADLSTSLLLGWALPPDLDLQLGVRTGSDGAPTVFAIPFDGGDEVWATAVGPPDPAVAVSGEVLPVSCGAGGEAVSVAVVGCLVPDGLGEDGDAAGTLVLLDARDGSVLHTVEAGPADGIRVAGSTVVAWSGVRDATRLTGYSATTGEREWSRMVAPPEDAGIDASGSSNVDVVDGTVVVTWYDERQAIAVLTSAGEDVEVPAGAQALVDVVDGVRTFVVGHDDGSATTLRQDVDGSVRELAGRAVAPTVDDGSLGDVVLTTADTPEGETVLTSWDPTTGRELWTSPWWPDTSTIVLGGSVHVAHGGVLVALDGLTGQERWRAPVGGEGVEAEGTWVELATDGRRLYAAVTRWSDDTGLQDTTTGEYSIARTAQLFAVTFDGDVHEIALPDEDVSVVPFDRWLWALSDAGARALV